MAQLSLSRASLSRSLLASAALACLLAACGGGDASGPEAGARAFAAQVQAAAAAGTPARKLALAVSTQAPGEQPQVLANVGAKELFDWAEYIYPTLFPKGPQNFPFTYLGTNYTIRSYPNGNYLGLTDGGLVYGLGPFTSNVLTPYGKLSDYVAQVQGDECNVYPGNCVDPNPTGALNECTMPAGNALAIGNRIVITYETTGGGATSTTTTDSLVDQNTTFEGQNVVRISSTATTSSSIGGVAINSTSKTKAYEQVATGGFTRSIGAETEVTSGGVVFMGQVIGATISNVKVVFNPAPLNIEYSIAAGKSITKSVSSTTTTTSSTNPTGRTISGTSSDVYTYERREPMTVRGKTYDTCRYKEVPSAGGSTTTQWIIVGKGIPVRIESVSDNVTSVTEMVSGTLNGAPL